MKNISRFILMAASFSLALAPVLASAEPGQGGRHFRGPGMGGHGPGLHGLMELDLEEDQREQIRGLFSAHRDSTESLREAHRQAQKAVAQQIHAEVLDETAIRQASEAAGTVEADLAVERAKLLQDLRKILTAEQLAELETLREQRGERREHRGERRERRRGFHHGSDEGER